MPKQLLTGPEVGPSLQEMRGERVSQGVRAHLSAMHRTLRISVDHGPDVAWPHATAPAVEEERLGFGWVCRVRGLGLHDEGPAMREVGAQGLCGVVAHGQRPFLGSLSHDPKPPTPEIEVVDVEGAELAY